MWSPLTARASCELTFVAGAIAAAALGLGWRPRARAALAMALPTAAAALGAHVAWARGGPAVAGTAEDVATVIALLACFLAIGAVPGAIARRIAARAILPPASAEMPAPPTRTAAPERRQAATVVLGRRAILRAAPSALPLGSAATGAASILFANGPPERPVRRLDVGDLPPELAGMCILQLSDLHLGVERSVADVERFVERLREDRVHPDLVALTGDFADDLDQLEPMLRAIAAIRPRLGTYACLGNHEHHLDPARVRRTFARSDAVLLEAEGVRVPGARLYVAGTGDVMGGDPGPFYEREVDRAVRDAGRSDLVLLLAHRPDAFLAARARGVGVTLSGHTHGGQIGWAGQSALEGPLRRKMWGTYGDARARLYLTSGFGHWFRFRLGCPTEAPLLLLAPSP